MVLFEIHQSFKDHFFNELFNAFPLSIHILVNTTKFVKVLRIYVHLSESYKHFITGKLIYFWKQDG